MTAAKPLPPLEYLHDCFTYCPETGKLIWKERPLSHFTRQQAYTRFKTMFTGAEAGAIRSRPGKSAYLHLSLDGRNLQGHRVAYYLGTGIDSPAQVDHRDGNGLNNRLANLRPVSRSGNQRNRRKSVSNISGVTGVYWVKARKRWVATITVLQRAIYLGHFDDLAAAKAARKEAERLHGFSDRHGT